MHNYALPTHRHVYFSHKDGGKFEAIALQMLGIVKKQGYLVPDTIKNKVSYKYIAGRKVQTLLPATVYYLSITFSDGTLVYKVGFTTTSIQQRIDYFELPPTTIVRVLGIFRCKCTKEAFAVEQLLHNHFKKYKYTGKPLLSSGNSELYHTALV